MADQPPDPNLKSGHENLLAKMDALVGRHRAQPVGESDDIPLLTDVVATAAAAAATTAAPSTLPAPGVPTALAEPAVAAPTAPTAPDSAGLLAQMEEHLVTALTQQINEQLSEQLSVQLQTQLTSAIHEVLQREGPHIARRIAARAVELMTERINRAR